MGDEAKPAKEQLLELLGKMTYEAQKIQAQIVKIDGEKGISEAEMKARSASRAPEMMMAGQTEREVIAICSKCVACSACIYESG